MIGLPDMESIAEYSAHGGTAQVSFLEVPPTHGTRTFGRFIDAEDLQHDKPVRAMVRKLYSPPLSQGCVSVDTFAKWNGEYCSRVGALCSFVHVTATCMYQYLCRWHRSVSC